MIRDDGLTLEDLEEALKMHKYEKKIVEMMNDRQYEVFKENLTIGQVADTRKDALRLLKIMIALNLKMQQEMKLKGGNNGNSGSGNGSK